MATRNHVDLVSKTLRVLEALAQDQSGIALKDVAQQAGLVKSSTFRILYTLREEGYAEQLAGGSYRLTPRMVGLARRAAARPTLIGLSRPRLERLRDRLHESVWLAEVRRGHVILVDGAEAHHHEVRLSFGIGSDCPLHATALGKAVAAFLPSAELSRLLGGGRLPRYTARTISSRAELDAHLAQVRRQGYALNQEETVHGASLVGAPIFDADNRPCAAISAGTVAARFTTSKRRAMIAEMRTAAAEISADLAHLAYRHADSEPPQMTRGAVPGN